MLFLSCFEDMIGDIFPVQGLLKLHKQDGYIDSFFDKQCLEALEHRFSLGDRLLLDLPVGLAPFQGNSIFDLWVLRSSPFEHPRRQFQMKKPDMEPGCPAKHVRYISYRSTGYVRLIHGQQNSLAVLHGPTFGPIWPKCPCLVPAPI